MNPNMHKVLWFGLPFTLDTTDETYEINSFFPLHLLIPLLAWIENRLSGEGFSFRTYEGSYWKALYRYIFKPESWD